jgi:hypothetical protein
MPAVIVGALVLAAFVAFTFFAYRRKWRWTGLPADPGDGSDAHPPRPAKTLWDWLQLLIVPLVLALAAFALNAAQSDRDREQEKRRADQERRLEERRAARDRASAEDRAREETLRTYIQQMSDLITRHGVQSSRGQAGADTATLARTLTLVALRRLDGARKGLVVQFLLEGGLITADTAWEATPQGLRRFGCFPVIPRGGRPQDVVDPCARLKDAPLSLKGADLRDAVMPSSLSLFADGRGPAAAPFRTRAAVLDDADLRNADFHGGSLMAVSFDRTDLRGADFTRATIDGASFADSCLSEATFARAVAGFLPADFAKTAGSRVDFSNASLERASFAGARLTEVKLDGAKTGGVEWPRNWTSTGIPMNDARAGRLCDRIGR